MATPHIPANKIRNDEHDSVVKARRVKIVEGNVSINAGDIQIGAVEIKDDITNNRLLVNTDGSIEVNVVNDDSNVFANYNVNDVESGLTTTYVGKSTNSGSWLIMKIDEVGTTTTIRWANVSNNAGTNTYNLAWTNKATMNYGLIGDLLFN